MPMDDDRGRGQTQSSPSGMGAGRAAERTTTSSSGRNTGSPGASGGDKGGGSNTGGGGKNTGGGGGGEAAREAAEKAAKVAAEKAADDARAKATQEAFDKKVKEDAAKKEVSDQKAREAAAAKAGEERRVREAAEKVASDKAAADKVVADQKAREAAFAASRDAAIQATETANRKAAADRAAALKYMQEQPSTGPTSRGGVGVQKGIEAVLDRYTGKTIKVESGGDPDAQNPNSSAAGLGQFTKGTWLKIVDTYRPDLMVGRTEAEILALRFNPELSVEMTKNLAKENAEGLTNAGFPVNESTLYLSHFLGIGGAIKMLNAPADAPASVVAGGAATTANQSILGGTKTAADVLRWASNKMDGTTPFNIADLDGSKLKNQLTNIQDRLFGGSQETVSNDQKKPDQYASVEDSRTRTDGIDSGLAERMKGSVDPVKSESDYFYDERGFDPVKATSPDLAEKPFYDKLIGAFNSFFDNTDQIKALEDQNRLAGGLTKEEYAKKFGVDPSKVQSRIVDYGQGQQVDYYTKSLGDVFGEAASDLGKGISNAGKGITSLFGGETSTAPTAEVYDKYGAAGDGSPTTGFGPGGDLTRDQYRDQYGGRDIATNLPPTGASLTPNTPTTPTTPTEPTEPTAPIMPTVPNFAAAQQYIGTPTVATPGFNFLMPFAPRPQVDFANLGQAYAPTALASAPPLQPLPGIPGAMYSTPYQRLG